jgi:hypothetical protein
MRTTFVGVVLGAVLSAQSASAYDAYDPKNCNGIDWDDKIALVVAKVMADRRVNFVKSPYDDDFKAETCPAVTAACRKKSYLVAGDLVLVGRTLGDFTCVTYQSPLARKQDWTTGWLPSSALMPVAPMASPRTSDWVGEWVHPGGRIAITKGGGEKLSIAGEQVVPTARDFHTGEIEATANPADDTIAFADDGSTPFDAADQAECRARLRRIGERLLVEDNSGCGGSGVSFTGLYRRKK